MRKVTLQDINDQYFFDNGYWKETTDSQGAFQFTIIVCSEKWRKLSDTLMRDKKNFIITAEDIVEAINGGTSRHKKENYKKLSQAEKDRRTAERHRLKDLKSNERRPTK